MILILNNPRVIITVLLLLLIHIKQKYFKTYVQKKFTYRESIHQFFFLDNLQLRLTPLWKIRLRDEQYTIRLSLESQCHSEIFIMMTDHTNEKINRKMYIMFDRKKYIYNKRK
jgi:ribosome-associated toxin RatA of RatAB toxin-antitoxin module